MYVEIAAESKDPVTLARERGEPIALPKQYNEYALIVGALLDPSLVEWCHSQVLERRAGAYEFIDIVLFLIGLFSASSPSTSISAFAGESGVYGPELAALVSPSPFRSF